MHHNARHRTPSSRPKPPAPKRLTSRELMRQYLPPTFPVRELPQLKPLG